MRYKNDLFQINLSLFGAIIFLDLRARLKIRESLPAKEPYGNDTDLIQNHQRHRHHQLIDDIRSWGQDRRNNKINKNCILTITVQKSDINHAYLGQKDHQHGHFKDDAKGKEQTKGQGKILTDRRQ